MSKQLKRKISSTLTTKSKALSTTKSRPSVFERLGTKAGAIHTKEYCHHWAQNGTCPYGKGCKYSSTHTLISPSKQRAAKSQGDKRRHSKDVTKRTQLGEENEDWDWNPEELEDADPDDLEKRRAELQRELEIQMKMEKTRGKKEKKVKKDSSPSSESSSSTTESTSSSEDSTSSSSSAETRRKKAKKTKSKRDSSSSPEDRKHKKAKRALKGSHHEKDKKGTTKLTKVVLKSPTPVRARKQSQTPPPKPKTLAPSKMSNSETKSPRPSSRSSGKEKHCTPSPKTKEKEREKEREKEKEREREREKEREREREREKEKEKEREKARERERAKEREREKDLKKKEKSPKRDSRGDSRSVNSIRRKDTPDPVHSKDRRASPSKSKGGISSTSTRRDHRSPLTKDDHRSSKRDDRDRSRQKDRNDPKNRKDRRDSREKERERERERRLAREKEREEALARCQERQRERERLKKLAAKEEEERRARDRSRRDDRGLDKPSSDRVERLLPLQKERLPQSSRKGHSSERDRSDRRDREVRRDRSPSDNRILRKTTLDHHERLDRDMDKSREYDRVYNRSADRSYERGRELERERDVDYARLHEVDRRMENSPYDRARLEDRRYLEMEEHYDAPREEHLALDGRDYVDERRSRRDIWDLRDERDMERERALDHHRYGRDERHSPTLKEREWDPEYAELEWNRRQEWQARENWDIDMKHATEEEWRLYNAGGAIEGWQGDDRRRWPAADWREPRDHSRPRSVASHNRDKDSSLDNRRKDHARVDPHGRNDLPVTRNDRSERNQSIPRSETAHEPTRNDQSGSRNDRERKESLEKKDVSEKKEPADKKETSAPSDSEVETPAEEKPAKLEPEDKETPSGLKRSAEQSLESPIEPKRPCIEPVLEDDLSEISDDADEILNRDEEILEEPEEESVAQENVETSSLKEHNSATSQKSQSPARSTANRLSKDGSIDEENMDLDFEEISEDELEEESRVKGIGDALGVDWASLVAESRPTVKPVSSAKKRWESHNVLFHLGISVELAGEDYVKEIYREHKEAEAKEKIPVENEENGIKVKVENFNDEKYEETNNHNAQITVKVENVKAESSDNEIIISDPLAEIQVANMEKANLRRTLLTTVGPYRRALSARRDLMIRRHLCNLPISDSFVEAPKRHDPELFKLAAGLLEKCEQRRKAAILEQC